VLSVVRRFVLHGGNVTEGLEEAAAIKSHSRVACRHSDKYAPQPRNTGVVVQPDPIKARLDLWREVWEQR
jgi:hypothetical protein